MTFTTGQVLNNRYRILDVLTQGATGNIYLATDTILPGRQYAIEALPPLPHPRQQWELSRRELSRLEALRHPNLLALLDYKVETDTPYLVFEYTPNGSLRDKYPRGSKVPLPSVANYLSQIADALQYLHGQHIVHQDVKPENLLVGSEGEVMLADFGIATSLYPTPTVTGTGAIGTPIYMAPEQFEGQITTASDQYSLAVVVYEWLCGQPPFQGDSMQVLHQQFYEPPPPLSRLNPTVPLDVERAVLKALEKNPHNRYRSVREFAQIFEQASVSDRSSASPSTAEKSPSDIPGSERTVTASPPEAGRSFGTGITDFITNVSDAIRSILPRLGAVKQPETELSLYAFARAKLENDELGNDDHALVGKEYTLEAGIAGQQLEEAVDEQLRITVQDPAQPLLFQILIQASPNITLLGEWSQPLRYSPLNTEPQFITCPFRLTAAGESSLLVNFYRERQWLKSIRLEFEGIEEAKLSTAARRG